MGMKRLEKKFDLPGGGVIYRILSPELEKNMARKEKYYNVTFVEDYAILQTTVAATNEDEAYDNAIEQVLSYYEIDLSSWRLDNVEETNG